MIGSRPVTADDYRRLARKRLPRFLFDYIDGGAGEEQSLAANREGFRRIRLLQRVMHDVGNVDTATVLAGRPSRMPLVLAPVGLAGMMAQRGEAQGARAAIAAGVPFTASTVGICPLEEIREACGESPWFQLYMLRERTLVEALLDQARASGCDTLVFTVDLPLAGPRHRDARNAIAGGDLSAALSKAAQLLSRPRWLWTVGVRGKPHDFGNLRQAVGGVKSLDYLKTFVDSQFDPTVTWRDIAWLRSLWQGKLIVKGVMCAQDAVAAAEVGADGVVVSNHGGRQLDGVAATIAKLPQVVAAVGERVEVYVDGGVRSGTDVVRALALGARGVLIGRPWVWAMAARGERGVSDLLTVFRSEMAVTMALMGVNRVSEISSELLDD
jgi:L-lactate dehydrogenase (cytochrome)